MRTRRCTENEGGGLNGMTPRYCTARERARHAEPQLRSCVSISLRQSFVSRLCSSVSWMAVPPLSTSYIGNRGVCIDGTTFHEFCSSIAAKSAHKDGKHGPKLLVSFTNYGYFDMAHNFIVALERLSIYNCIMFALDVPSFERLKQLGIATWLLTSREDTVYTQSSSSFGTPEFNSICNVKPWIVLECLRGGFDVVWTDTDVIWLRVRVSSPSSYFLILPHVCLSDPC